MPPVRITWVQRPANRPLKAVAVALDDLARVLLRELAKSRQADAAK